MILVRSVDGGREGRQVVTPVAVRDGAVCHAARFGQHLEADEGGLGGQHLVFVAQERADDVRHDALRPASGNDVFGLGLKLRGQPLAQVQTAGRIEIQRLHVASHGFDSERRRTQRIFVGRELDDPREAVSTLDLGDVAARFIGPQGFDCGWDQRHGSSFS